MTDAASAGGSAPRAADAASGAGAATPQTGAPGAAGVAPGSPGAAEAAPASPGVADTAGITPPSRRRPPTLRRRLLAVLAGLVLLSSAVVGVVSVAVLHSSLVARLDAQLLQVTSRTANVVQGIPGGAFPVPPGGVGELLSVPGQPVGTIVAVVTAGDLIAASASIDEQGDIVGLTEAALAPLGTVEPADGPTTVQLGGIGRYRAVAAPGPEGSQAAFVVALPLAEVEETTAQLALTVLVVAVGGLAIALVLGAVIVARALQPLAQVTRTATLVSELPLARGDVALPAGVDVDDDDRTEVGRLGAAFNRMLGHVAASLTAREQSERKVRRFVADASHELRTPLASIRGYAELTRLHGGALPDDVMHAIGRIESESVRMTELVEDLLLLARLDEGRELRREPVDLVQLVRDAVGDAQVAGPDHVWSADVPEQPVVVLGDDARLRQVLANLLANARVHTPEGTSVEARLERVPASGSVAHPVARLHVRDDGPGIEPAVRDRLFERFARGDASRSRRAGSTGLGLAIVSAVVAAHGGRVSVTSEPGDTEFTVELPLAPA